VDGGKSAGASNVLDLGKEQDIADYFLRTKGERGPGDDEGYESAASSASSIGGDDPELAFDLPDDYVGRNNKRGERRAVKLDEIGPRMEISLLKMAEGLPGKDGSVIYHRFVKKTMKEINQQKAEHHVRTQLKKQRREEQERNVAAKKQQKGQNLPDGQEEKDLALENDDENSADVEEDWDENASVSESESEASGDSDADEEDGDDDDDEPPTPAPQSKKRKL